MLALFVILGLLAIIVIRIPQIVQAESFAAEALFPIQRALNGVFGGLGGITTTIARAAELKAENDRLRAELDGLQAASARIQELEHRNAELEAQLSFTRANSAYSMLPARVIGRDPTDLVHSITIDRGSRDGLQEGMTVVTPAGLVGRLIGVGPVSSKVLLISDTKSSVAGVIASSRAQGMVYGRRQQALTMRYIDQKNEITVGEWAVTSNLGGAFPPGILIGQVVHVRQRDIETFQEATLEPAVDFRHLENVLVITSYLPVPLE